jgi:hypothetical protein
MIFNPGLKVFGTANVKDVATFGIKNIYASHNKKKLRFIGAFTFVPSAGVEPAQFPTGV